jgi:aspartyl-tRNA(Asn)/glutamyl-tRNA(Gln) amidotransferase subunit A
MKTLFDLARKLEKNKLSSRQLVEHCLANIDDEQGEGHNTFISVYRERALAEADDADRARKQNRHTSPFAGIPLSIKDLLDVAGEVTTAGSHVLDEQRPATRDAPVVQRLRSAGFIVIGRTNMTEFAYSGLGINSHYGTPASPWDRSTRRIPGGSSSGAAVSVTDDMAAGAIGTDTGGSTRIPAAMCGIVGFKPTAERVPTEGCTPLSTTLDSIGPLANTVTCCGILDAIMAGSDQIDIEPFPQVGLRLGVVEGLTTEDLDPQVASAYQDALTRLGKRGVLTKVVNLPELEAYYAHANLSSIVGGEALAWHQQFLPQRAEFYDPWVLKRIEASKSYTAADYVDALHRRQACQHATSRRTSGLDAIVMPTCALPPQPIATLTYDADASRRVNMLNLRNTSIANTLNAPAISIPCHPADSAPVGFMLIGKSGSDRELLSIAHSIEAIVRGSSE